MSSMHRPDGAHRGNSWGRRLRTAAARYLAAPVTALPGAPWSVRLASASLLVESVTVAGAGFIALLYCLAGAVLGSLAFAAVAGAGGIAALAVAFGIIRLQCHSLARPGPFRILTVLLHVLMAIGGVALIGISNNLTAQAGRPQTPGTDGPFADGATGFIGLLGLVFLLSSTAITWGLIVDPRSGRYFRRPRRRNDGRPLPPDGAGATSPPRRRDEPTRGGDRSTRSVQLY